MNYNELEDLLDYFNHMENEYGKLKQKSNLCENDYEQMGCISGELHETVEILRSAFVNTKEMYNNIMQYIQNHCPNSYKIITNNLNNNASKYTRLYDLLIEVNMKREDNVYFPTKLTQTVGVYR